MFFLSACKKCPDPQPEPPPSPGSTRPYNYPLTIGSYWIYERFNLDTNGVEAVVSVDSSYISGDTVIGGNTYSVFVGDIIGPTGFYFRRDSLGYLVDPNGVIRGSNTNFTDTLWAGSTPGYADFYYKMISGTSLFVPAGTFTAFDYLGTVNVLFSGYMWDNPRYLHSYYADSVGLIRETSFFILSPNYIGRKLVRYHIQ